MISVDYCELMADYNCWMNQRLYEICNTLSDEDRKQDKAAPFGSIHSLLNHILYGDLAFMSRFTGNPSSVPELGIDLYEDFNSLRQARHELDERIIKWVLGLGDRWLKQKITYTSKVDNVSRTVPHWVLVTHMFNHETHHRGQITTLLCQRNLLFEPTDIPFMPRFNKSDNHFTPVR